MSTPAHTPLLSFKSPAIVEGRVELPVMVSCGEWTVLTADAATLRRVATDIIAAVDRAPRAVRPPTGKLGRTPLLKPSRRLL